MSILSLNSRVFGKHTVYFDADKSELISQYRWYLHKSGGFLYARGYKIGNRSSGLVYMHRLLTKAPKRRDVDHKNQNGLDNRAKNLRVCTRTLNNKNRPRTKGYYFDSHSGKYKAETWINGKKFSLGRFASEKEARSAYLKFNKKRHGSFLSHL